MFVIKSWFIELKGWFEDEKKHSRNDNLKKDYVSNS